MPGGKYEEVSPGKADAMLSVPCAFAWGRGKKETKTSAGRKKKQSVRTEINGVRKSMEKIKCWPFENIKEILTT